MALWSHRVTSRVTVRTYALHKSILIRAPLLLQKKTNNAFGCIVFERRVGQLYMCVYTFILCHFVYI